jgi:RNA polymerase sigma-70 factor (ECF subfamily)
METKHEGLRVESGGIRFADVYARHSEPILRFFARRVLEPEVAMDLTAETFAQAFLSFKRFRGDLDQGAAPWLFGIARNVWRRYVRKGAAEGRAIERLGVQVPLVSADDQARIDELAELAELRAAAKNGLANLPVDQRRALLLRVVEELPYCEIARRLEVSEETARARVSRGLRALAASLDREGRNGHG